MVLHLLPQGNSTGRRATGSGQRLTDGGRRTDGRQTPDLDAWAIWATGACRRRRRLKSPDLCSYSSDLQRSELDLNTAVGFVKRGREETTMADLVDGGSGRCVAVDDGKLWSTKADLFQWGRDEPAPPSSPRRKLYRTAARAAAAGGPNGERLSLSAADRSGRLGFWRRLQRWMQIWTAMGFHLAVVVVVFFRSGRLAAGRWRWTDLALLQATTLSDSADRCGQELTDGRRWGFRRAQDAGRPATDATPVTTRMGFLARLPQLRQAGVGCTMRRDGLNGRRPGAGSAARG
ncbi:hypothetical protein ACLOJK_030643 [Asimina triloba]